MNESEDIECLWCDNSYRTRIGYDIHIFWRHQYEINNPVQASIMRMMDDSIEEEEEEGGDDDV